MQTSLNGISLSLYSFILLERAAKNTPTNEFAMTKADPKEYDGKNAKKGGRMKVYNNPPSMPYKPASTPPKMPAMSK